MHDIPTITLKAKRVSTSMHKGDMIVFAYSPSASSIGELQAKNRLRGQDAIFRLDLDDETGTWSSGAKWLIVEFDLETHYTTSALRMVMETPQG